MQAILLCVVNKPGIKVPSVENIYESLYDD